MRSILVQTAAVGTLALALSGCGNKQKTATLKPQEFYTPQHRVMPLPAEQGSRAEAPQAAAPVPVTPPANAGAVNGAGDGAGNGNGPTANVATTNTPAATPAAAGDVSAGSYMLVGTVIGEVNGSPIFADKILARAQAAIYSKATQTGPDKLNAGEFQRWVTGLIRDQVREQVNDELLFAAAQRNTSDQDQSIAAGMTTVFRNKEITKAGGSLAVAKANAQRDGMDFDERVQQEYRRRMVGIYLARRVWPRVSVTADDVREFYNRNIDAFTEKAEVRFRVIKIGVRERGDRDAALKRARELFNRATTGAEDFARLAAQYNDDTAIARNRGYMSMAVKKDELGQPLKTESGSDAMEGAWYAKGSMVNEDLEKAIFAMEPGQVSEPIDQGAYFFVVKLEEKKAGRVRTFEDPEVQELISKRLEAEQQRALREKEIVKLRNASILKGAATFADDRDLAPAVEMAMQTYHSLNRGQPSVSAR